MKQAFYTAFAVVAVTALLNQIPATKSLLSGQNRFFN